MIHFFLLYFPHSRRAHDIILCLHLKSKNKSNIFKNFTDNHCHCAHFSMMGAGADLDLLNLEA